MHLGALPRSGDLVFQVGSVKRQIMEVLILVTIATARLRARPLTPPTSTTPTSSLPITLGTLVVYIVTTIIKDDLLKYQAGTSTLRGTRARRSGSRTRCWTFARRLLDIERQRAHHQRRYRRQDQGQARRPRFRHRLRHVPRQRAPRPARGALLVWCPLDQLDTGRERHRSRSRSTS